MPVQSGRFIFDDDGNLSEMSDAPRTIQFDLDGNGILDPAPQPTEQHWFWQGASAPITIAFDYSDSSTERLDQTCSYRGFAFNLRVATKVRGLESNGQTRTWLTSAEVDEAGCSADQFCSSIKIDRGRDVLRCLRADWRNDEPLRRRPLDCTVAWMGDGRGWSALECVAR